MTSVNTQLRLSTCLETIVEVHTSISDSRLDESLIGKFKQLEQSLRSIDLEGVSEKDIQRVEDATNRLLDELKRLFLNKEANPIHPSPLH